MFTGHVLSDVILLAVAGMGAEGNGNKPLGMGVNGIEKDILAHL